MSRVLRSAVIAGLVVTLGGAASWGQVPSTNDTSDNNDNTGGGKYSLNAATGSHNTAYGLEALYASTGSNNTALGYLALNGATSGFGNTASGGYALESNSTGFANAATGYQALRTNTAGFANTATGAKALLSNSGGADNTALGFQALSNSTGSRNTALGFNAGIHLSSGDNNIYLDNTAVASESNTMRLGQGAVTANGTTSGITRTFVAGIYGVPLSSGNPKAAYVNSSGQVGVLASSARYKRDIQDMRDRSQGLYRLRSVTFRYKHDPHGQQQYGLIAEEVAKVYPELVTKGADGKFESVQYHELIPMLLNEVQHQQQKLETQAQELAELKAQAQEVVELKARLERLEQGATRTATAATR